MKAYKTSSPTGYVAWSSLHEPDFSASQSGYLLSELSLISINKIERFPSGGEVIDGYLAPKSNNISNSTGFIRVSNDGEDILFTRAPDDTVDAELITLDRQGDFVGLNIGGSYVTMNLIFGQDQKISFLRENDEVLKIGDGYVAFAAALSDPTIYQQNKVTGNGNDFIIQAQSTAGGLNTGGDLRLKSGEGGSGNGLIKLEHGNSGDGISVGQGYVEFLIGEPIPTSGLLRLPTNNTLMSVRTEADDGDLAILYMESGDSMVLGSPLSKTCFDTYNLSIFSRVSDFNNGRGLIYIKENTTLPTSDPSNGGYLYVKDGELVYHGPDGTVTVLAPS